MLETGVMGVYEPKNKTLLIGTHVAESMLDMVVGHEIAHGLQDMHFDLERLQKPIRGDSDAEAARTYLVEGDAQAAYLAWVSGERGLASITTPCSSPPATRPSTSPTSPTTPSSRARCSCPTPTAP
jgi:hypothetical protein